MDITEEKTRDIQIYKIDGLLVSHTSAAFEKRMVETISQGGRRIIFDFQNLEYLSSAGLRVILQTYERLKRLGGKLVLCCLADYIKEIFEISGFDSFLPIAGDQDDAKRLFL